MRQLFPVLLVAACGGSSSSMPDAAIDASVDAGLDAADAMPDAAWGLALALEQTTITGPSGIGAEVDVTITRTNFDGEVAISLVGTAPAGVTAPALAIPAGETTATFVVWIADDATAATHALTLEARAGGATATAPLSVVVDPDAGKFLASWTPLKTTTSTTTRRAALSAPTWSITAGAYLRAEDGYASTVDVRWYGLPATVTGAGGSTLVDTTTDRVDATLTPAAAALEGAHAITLIASDGSLRQELIVDLSIVHPGIDASIGSGGRVTSDPAAPFRAAGVDVDSAGRPYVLGYDPQSGGRGGARRYTTAGALDTTYGSGGTASVGPVDGVAVDGAVANDLVYLLGHQAGAITLGRLAADGSPDAAWGTQGVVTVTTGHGADVPRRFRVRGNGTIYVAGEYSSPRIPEVVCVTAAGALCSSFGETGVASLAVDGATFWNLAFDSQSRIVAVGGTDNGDILVARFTAAGQPDLSFSADGYALFTTAAADPMALDVQLDGSDRVVVTGGAFVARLDTAGVLDPTFSGNGVLDLPSSGLGRYALTHVRVTATAIVGFGSFTDGTSPPRPVLIRIDPAGELEPTFGLGGTDVLFGGDPTRAEEVAGFRAVMGTFWVVARVLDADEFVVLKHTGM